MPAYGVDLETWAAELQDLLPTPSPDRDSSIDAAVYLGLAFLALRRLENTGVSMRIRNRLLVFPNLEHAFRELLYIRLHKLSIEQLSRDIKRPVTLTRAGSIDHADKVSLRDIEWDLWNTDAKAQRRARDAAGRRGERVRARRASKSIKSKDPGDRA